MSEIKMSNDGLKKIEEAYLQIFKVVIIIVLSIALLVSGVMLISGVSDYFATPSNPEPAKTAPKPSVSVDEFLKSFDKKEEQPTPAAIEPQEKPAPVEKKDISLDAMTDLYLGKLWVYLDKYQAACNPPVKVDKETFFRTFDKQFMKNLFRSYGKDYAESQDKFEQAVLSNQRIIQICKEKDGKSGVFYGSLNWFKSSWQTQLEDGKQFEIDERQRVKDFAADERARVIGKKAGAFASLMVAAISFGVFMSLALLLIFSKIETNLRGIKEIERGV